MLHIAFDIGGAQFGHRGNLCTFETMVTAFRLDDPRVRAISEIVHEIDLHDGRHARPEIPGVDAILKGWSTHTDPERESHGIALFNGLHASLSQTHGVPLKRRR